MTDPSTKWIDAFADPLATLYTFGTCLTLADLNGDGDYKLIIADLGTGKFNMRLKVYKGVNLIAEQALVDLPTAVVTFVMDNMSPCTPAIAVASGSNVYVYKNLKPYYKFSLPSAPIDDTEQEVWTHVRNGQLDSEALSTVLMSLKEKLGMSNLSVLSQRYLLLSSMDQREDFIQKQSGTSLKCQSIVTCMATLKKASLELAAIDTLVLGCENGQVLTVDAEAFTPLSTATVPSIPVFMHASGLFDVEYRLLVCCRDGCVYTLKRENPVVKKATIELNCHAVNMSKAGKQVVIACTDRTLRRFTLKGRRLSCMTMPGAITALEVMEYEPKGYVATLVALDNREIHIYQDTFLVDQIKLDDIGTALRFGRFGREEGALVICTRGGGLQVKLFKRTAKFEEKSSAPGAPAAQLQKLNIPRKSKIYVDQTMRERDEAPRMHQVFQRDLFMLRLQTARSYAKMLQTNLNPVSMNSEEMLKLSVQLLGFGPIFQLVLYLQTSSVQAVHDLTITFHYNNKLYSIDKPIIPVAMLVPGMQYTFITKVHCLMADKGLTDDIKVYVVRSDRNTPCLTAQITMPVSEQTLID